MSEPAAALHDLAELLRADRSVVSPCVADAQAVPTLGILAASGIRTASASGEYALVVEAVREGYLLHYGGADATRVVVGADADLALLAGDYLYALGLERLAALGDLAAVRELSDLISLAAQVHDGSREPSRAGLEAAALWLAAATAIAGGPMVGHERGKAEVRARLEQAPATLVGAAAEAAAEGGFRQAWEDAAAGLDLRSDHLSSLG